jgi:signal transduction histidine kinase
MATADVASAEAAIAAGDVLEDPRYLETLLRSAPVWLAASGCQAEAPGWLVERIARRDTSSSGACDDRAGGSAREPSPVPASESPSTSPGRAGRAHERWLVPPGFASGQFALVAVRLARLHELERHFEAKLEEEKLAALVEFAAGAGHEINNPLAVISGRAQLLLRHERDTESRRELAVINVQARRVHEMIADLMHFGRPAPPCLAELDAQHLIERIIDELAPRARQQGVEVRFAAQHDLPPLMADAAQLEVALRAVCENALDALGPGGGIEIRSEIRFPTGCIDHLARDELPKRLATKNGDTRRQIGLCMAITVRDNGPGMGPEVRRHAFDPFFSGRSAGRGLGFGLSKCWRIVTAHGGHVDIDSNESGTSVSLLLPTVPTARHQPASSAVSEP